MSRSYKIMSIEAKDLYSALKTNNRHGGYKIRDNEGNIRLGRFVNTLDDSLDTRKLRDVYEKTTRRKDFAFTAGNHSYCPHVINVKFSYSYKEWNTMGLNTYVKAGYDIRELEIIDGVCVIGDELVAIQTNVEIKSPIHKETLGKYFCFNSGHYEQVGNIPTLLSRADLRRYLYENGFMCDGVYFRRYKRSAGSGRLGKCLFANSVVTDKMEVWDKCGLKINYADPVDLAAYESYISLTMSSIIDTIEIQPHEILIIDDFVSEFNDMVVSVTEDEGMLVAQKDSAVIKNDIWDGQSLADTSLFNDYYDKGVIILRNRFFKTAAFNTNIQQWFEDNDITSVGQLNGYTLAKNISDIKLITTPNSIKYLKFGSLEQWLNNIDSNFGVVKTEKPTKFFGGRLVATHYQLLNTLALSRDDVASLVEPSMAYLSLLRSDPDVLRHHIGMTLGTPRKELKMTPLITKNDIVFKMLGINNDFAYTKYYKDFRANLIKSIVRDLKRGRILVPGNYSTLFGNGYEMLSASIGRFDGHSILQKDEVHCSMFNDGEEVLASRSPHICGGNILLVKNTANELISKYFNLSNEIVCVNSIGVNVLQRLNGADYDGDAMLLTNHKLLIDRAKENYYKFLVPTCDVPAEKTNRIYSDGDKADLDIKTSINKIGEIVNLSQELNSLFWHRHHAGETFESLDELYMDICLLSVLSGLEIDRAKKEIQINSQRELSRLIAKYRNVDGGKTVKPSFFKTITVENGYTLSDNIKYESFDTPMDYLQTIVDKTNLEQSRFFKSRTKPFMSIVHKPNNTLQERSMYYRRDRVLELVNDASLEILQMQVDYAKYRLTDKEYSQQIMTSIAEKTSECVNKIMSYMWCESSLYLTLIEVDRKENSAIAKLLLEVLFQTPNSAFFSLIKQSVDIMNDLTEDENGDIRLYNFGFKKEKSVPNSLFNAGF